MWTSPLLPTSHWSESRSQGQSQTWGEGRDWEIRLPARRGRRNRSWHVIPDTRFLAYWIVIKILLFVVSRMTNKHRYWSVNGLQESVLLLAQVKDDGWVSWTHWSQTWVVLHLRFCCPPWGWDVGSWLSFLGFLKNKTCIGISAGFSASSHIW